MSSTDFGAREEVSKTQAVTVDEEKYTADAHDGISKTNALTIDEEKCALEGYDVSADNYDDTSTLKRTADGRIVLVPQPSDDPVDPLNWSPAKKAITLAIVAYIAFLPDYTAGVGIVTLIPQAM